MIPRIERATHLIGRAVEAEVGLRQAEAHVLARLAQGDTSIADLHHSFGHKRSTLTALLDRLESRGLVRRRPHPSDRRSVIVTLTTAGRAAGRRAVAAVDRIESRIGAQVTEEQLDGFHAVLDALEQEAR